MAIEPLIGDLGDTARWVAMYRARETERPEALFHDPFARRLAGDRRERIAAAIPGSARGDWSFAIRMYLFDRVIEKEVAGDRVALFQRIGSQARRVLVVSEGLPIYLSEADVGALATDLAAVPGVDRWVVDVSSPGLVNMTRRRMRRLVDDGSFAFRLAPEDGPEFFTGYGWQPVAVHSLHETAARKERLPLIIRLLSLLPEPKGPRRIWSGVSVRQRSSTGT